jgi:hypothetical protein
VATQASQREQLEEVARVIATNNRLSHDWEDFVEAARALVHARLVELVDPMAHDGAEPVHFVVHEERPGDFGPW